MRIRTIKEILELHTIIIKIMKFIEIHVRIMQIMKILQINLRIMKIMKILIHARFDFLRFSWFS